MIKLKNITKTFGERTLFSNFSYDFPDHGIVAIVGESGTGKTTLLNLISGLDFSYKGEAKILNKNLSKFNEKKLADFRLKNIGYVFQNFNLLNLDTVFNNIYLPIDTVSNVKTRIKKQRVLDAISLVGLEGFDKKKVNKLSGGEKQRVAIARAVINNPSIILCDEPTGSLDEKNGQAIFGLLKKISKDKLVIVATHDLEGISKIANVILELKNQEFIVKKLSFANDFEKPLLIGTGKFKHNPRVSFLFKLKHSFNKMKSKKYRSIIINVMLSLSLTGVGLSLIITSSVSTKVNDAFKSILNGNQIVMSLKNENENTFTNSYSASYENVSKIYKKYNYLLDGIGVNYLVNFEDFFKDKNELFICSSPTKIFLNNFSARNINDFKWITEDDESVYYPMPVESIDDDQIVLGITYEEMVNICFQLHIQRNFTSLGHYIYEKGLMVSLSIENSSWEYDDEQIFEVVAVTETNYSRILHTNFLWNEIVFEEMMRLPSDDDDSHYYPWEMFKIYYLQTKEDPSIFIDASFVDEELNDFVFERTNFNYNPSLCKYGDVCKENRIYIYITDKYCVAPSVVEKIKREVPFINSYYYTSDFGYASYSSNIFSGFSKNVFLSNDEEMIDKAIDADTQLNNETNLLIDLPENVIQGNFINSLSNGLRFSSNPGQLLYGRMPTNLNEIVISEGLAKKLDENTLCFGKYLSFAGEINEFIDEKGRIEKEYNTSKILVVGIADESKNYIYHKPHWTVSFFRDKLGVSSFNLIPRSVVFEFENKEDADKAFEQIKNLAPEYKIINPLEELNSNIYSTLEYANTILICFSILATIISILLLGTVLMLNIIESKDEIQLFKFLGITRNQVNSIFTFQGLVQGFIAFLISAVELIVVDFLISFILGDYLNIGFEFSLNITPIIVIFVMSILIPLIISKVMMFFLARKKE